MLSGMSDRFFNSDVGNWPDFREESQRPNRKSPPSYKTFWCHGAPGIALSRLRAYQITGNEVYKEEAEIALNTTRAAVVASMDVSSIGLFAVSWTAGKRRRAHFWLPGARLSKDR